MCKELMVQNCGLRLLDLKKLFKGSSVTTTPGEWHHDQ